MMKQPEQRLALFLVPCSCGLGIAVREDALPSGLYRAIRFDYEKTGSSKSEGY